MFATKSSSPYPERKKKPRLKFAWNKNKAIDYDNCRQIDFFIQDVIEKAKEDYRRVYMDINGQCNNATDMIDSTDSDNCCLQEEALHIGNRQSDNEGQSAFGISKTCRFSEPSKRITRQDETVVEMKALDRRNYQGERKPLIDKQDSRHCCSQENICSRIFVVLTCYQCRCLQNIFRDG